ncbi:hydantoinase/oxoprolinase family protein [Thauera sp. 2A1]|uniref:hydantoinase/oxoprolinase family protein n=1 Tax=Thauera sp. 2A1 TaxID=2570191 RepID=UPI0012929E91|nr:hydantoinase/oxoprolinase family protein [Thauera sp. 2A1]KAI5916868.1 H4MPT-linked C1 transfer pathway protein [Thauera sp. 2A1]
MTATTPARPDTAAAPAVIGWDIGGAHVKASLLVAGRIADIAQWPTPMWQGLEHLDKAVAATRKRWLQFGAARHAVTMTAEMADLFPNREAGVLAIASRVGEQLGSEVRFFAGEAGWAKLDAVAEHWEAIASANWLATARMVALRHPDALLVDIGSTTTDLIPIAAGQPSPVGRSDAARLASGELVYLGVVRTPLCALARRIPFDGTYINVMNEFFATTADIFRLTGELDAEHDQYPPADGGSKDTAATCQRLARMIGRDSRDASEADWREFAEHWRRAMTAEIARNVSRVESRLNATQVSPPTAESDRPADSITRGTDAGHASADATRVPIVGAGCGLFLAHALAQRLDRPFLPFDALIDADPACRKWVATCAPAVAVAVLLEREMP